MRCQSRVISFHVQFEGIPFTNFLTITLISVMTRTARQGIGAPSLNLSLWLLGKKLMVQIVALENEAYVLLPGCLIEGSSLTFADGH